MGGELGSEQAECVDNRGIVAAVLDGDELRLAHGVDFLNRGCVPRVQLNDVRIFRNSFGGEIAEFINLVCERVPFLA